MGSNFDEQAQWMKKSPDESLRSNKNNGGSIIIYTAIGLILVLIIIWMVFVWWDNSRSKDTGDEEGGAIDMATDEDGAISAVSDYSEFSDAYTDYSDDD